MATIITNESEICLHLQVDPFYFPFLKMAKTLKKKIIDLVPHTETLILVRLVWITIKFLKIEKISLTLEHSHRQNSEKYLVFSQIFKNFLLLHANLTKLMDSKINFSLYFGQNLNFSCLPTLHVSSQDSKFTSLTKYYIYFAAVHSLFIKSSPN